MSWFFRIASLTLLAAKIGQGEKQEGRLAVVKSIYGAYDAPIDVKIADASGLVDYYLFTDEFLDTSDLKMTKVVTTPFHLRDPSSQVPGAKNSLDGIPLNPLFRGKPKFLRMRLNMMAIKYYKMMAWKVPLLANYDYIMHVDANFLLSNPNLRRDALKLLSNQTFLSTRHPRGWGGIQWEAIEATYQKRYRNDKVKVQVKAYLADGFPDHPKKNVLLYGGMFMYRTHNQNARNMLQSWFAQVQNYSIEDQISYPYVYWKSNMEYSRTVLLPKDLCKFLSPFAKAPVTDASKIAGPYGSCYEAHTVDKKLYGKA